MNFKIYVIAVLSMILLAGCDVKYYLQSAEGQYFLWYQRRPFDEALKDPKISENEKTKIRLVQQVKQFAESDLGLKATHNYTDYVPLGRDSVVYAVNASEKWQLKNFLWNFPFVGSVPYKGYFNEPDALEEAKSLENKNYDTYVRGVSAYSTLGYFRDSLLSSMTQYKDYDLVNTIIHETTHTTLYLEGNADFNERLAVFVGNIGTERFYLMKEGPNSPTLALIKNINEDELLFSRFIKRELEDLQVWYENSKSKDEEVRKNRLRQIQEDFLLQLKPQLKSENYAHFDKVKLNNARLMLYKTYLSDLSEFARLFEFCKKDLTEFLKKCKGLDSSKNPEEDLKKISTCDP